MKEREDTGRDVLSFIAGAMLGAGLALLYAPKTGKEIRDQVSDFTDDAMAKVKEFSSDAQEKVRTSFSKGKEIAQEKVASFRETKDEMVH